MESASAPSSSSSTNAANETTTGSSEDVQYISMHEFLDFLKLSCQVHEQLVQPTEADAHVQPPITIIDPSPSHAAAQPKPASATTTQQQQQRPLSPMRPSSPQTAAAAAVAAAAASVSLAPVAATKNVATKRSPINLNELAHNPLIKSLKSMHLGGVPKANSSNKTPRSDSSSGSQLDRRDSNKKSASSTSSSRSARKSKDSQQQQLHPALEHKLSEVIDEGILDSVLQFMCPPPSTPSNANKPTVDPAATTPATATATSMMIPTVPSHKLVGNQLDAVRLATANETAAASGRTMTPNAIASTAPGTATAISSRSTRRKSVSLNNASSNGQSNGDSLVTIHVCDEVKNVSRDFVCPQALLVAQMGYFADVTAGQRLEDMDISVHCDVQIFEWLMRWVKRDQAPADAWPLLDASNVVPILVSASFLQMEPLLADALAFCHAHLADVVRASANTACLNDAIIGRLAAMFTNLELEAVRDRRERVTPRLWCKLIQSLAEPEPQQLRGHYACVADLFRCVRCNQYLTQAVATFVHCAPQQMRMNRWGQIVSKHTKDTAWSLSNYVGALHRELRSWRRVYWRLWGGCHFLYCVICETHFPVGKMKWCLYHPEGAQFLGPATEGRMAGPAGRYPCCGQQAFRYEPLPGPIGCQYREHTVQLETDRDRAILKLCQQADEGGCLYEAPPVPLPAHGASHQHQHQQTAGEQLLWQGVQLAPCRAAHSNLLPPLGDDVVTSKPSSRGGHHQNGRRACGGATAAADATDEEPDDDDDDDESSGSDADSSSMALEKCMRQQVSSSSDGYESDNSGQRSALQLGNKATNGGCCKSASGGAGSSTTTTTTTTTTTLANASTARLVRRHHNHNMPTTSSSSNRRRPLRMLGRHWSSDMSARSNQDNQREFEERAMRQVITMVGKRTGSDTNLRYQSHQMGGKYVKLESEWRESVRQKLAQGKAKK